jgi:hypothetical protein
VVSHEEWEVLYRQRLQVERDLLRGQGQGGSGSTEESLIERVGRAVEVLVGR